MMQLVMAKLVRTSHTMTETVVYCQATAHTERIRTVVSGSSGVATT